MVCRLVRLGTGFPRLSETTRAGPVEAVEIQTADSHRSHRRCYGKLPSTRSGEENRGSPALFTKFARVLVPANTVSTAKHRLVGHARFVGDTSTMAHRWLSGARRMRGEGCVPKWRGSYAEAAWIGAPSMWRLCCRVFCHWPGAGPLHLLHVLHVVPALQQACSLLKRRSFFGVICDMSGEPGLPESETGVLVNSTAGDLNAFHA